MTQTTISRPIPRTAAEESRPTATTTGRRSVRRFRLRAVGAAVLANSALYLGAHALGTDFVLTAPNNPVPHPLILAEIIGISLVFSLLGWGTLALFERFTHRARLLWSVLATVVLVLSFVPLGIEHATVDTKIMLGLMHLVVAAALLPMPQRAAPRR